MTSAPEAPGDRRPWLILLVAVPLLVLALRGLGRVWVCAHGDGLVPWYGDAWGPHTSQHLLDPYSFTHMLHGFVFCAAMVGVARRWGGTTLAWIVCVAVILEGGWELLENSPWIIERYRTQTAAMDYAGDSIVNSLGDLLSCGGGAILAHRLGLARGVATYVGVELALLAWIRDCLTLNVIMLIHPIEAIRLWQQG